MSWPDEPFLNLRQTATPKGTPANGGALLYVKSDGKLYTKNASGVEALVGPADLTPYAPLASPTFTGDPKAPTPTAGDNDTSIATTAFVKAAIDAAMLAAHPVGSIEVNVTGTNPSTYIGGTWVAWGTGRVPVGVDTGQTEFNTVEKTGGEKTHLLTAAEMPSHSHSKANQGTTAQDGNSSYGLTITAGYQGRTMVSTSTDYQPMGSTGGDSPHNNLQPYITCYMWKRTA